MGTVENLAVVFLVIGFCNCALPNTDDVPGSVPTAKLPPSIQAMRSLRRSWTVSVPNNGYTRSPSGNLYKLHNDLLPWSEAAKVCETEGGTLAVIDSEAEAVFLTRLMMDALPHMDTPAVLLGYSRRVNRQFTTITGKALNSTGFSRMSFSGPMSMGLKGGNCGSLQPDGGIGRFPCHTPAPYLCQRSNETLTLTTPDSVSPGAGYVLVQGLGWYKVHGDNKKWHDASRACEAEGAHLAVLNSDAEATALKTLMSRQRNINYGVCGCAFIGFHDLSKEGHFITVFGDPLETTGFTTWGPGNPSNSGYNEDCGSITYRGDLNDLSCYEEYPFICEHPTNTLAYNTSINTNVTSYQIAYENYPGIGSYKLHTDGKTWTEAKEVCEKEGGTLAVVNSEAESDVIRKLMGRNPDLELADGVAVFLGFREVEGNGTTVFGQNLNELGFKRWANKVAISVIFNDMCGGLDRKGSLVYVNCNHRAPFVCEKLTSTFNRTVPRPPQGGYLLLAGQGFYRLSVVRATWHEAKAICEGEDAHLAIITSNEESLSLQRMISVHVDNKNINSFIFLGFHDQTTEGRFETVFGTPLSETGYNNWAPFNPDNMGRGEDCGTMDRKGYLHDVQCDTKLPFICERELNYTSTMNAYDAPNRLTVIPEHIHVKEGGGVTVLCNTDEPIIECHFKTTKGDFFDLSRGRLIQPFTEQKTGDISTYSYEGRGLNVGDCGMTFTLSPGLQRIMVGCRSRSLHSGWKYGYTSVQASDATSLDTERLSAAEVLVRNTTESLRLLWQASTPLAKCKCILPSQSMETILVDPDEISNEWPSEEYKDSYEDEVEDGSLPRLAPDPLIGYHGQGFKTGQCGIELKRPGEWNGFLWCGMGSERGWEWRSAAIIVAKPPGLPELMVHASQHSDGAILEAECRVGPSRPVSTITWYLGDEKIQQDSLDASPSVMWAWPSDDQWITQKLTRQLRADDRGKELICEAGHVALPSGSLRAKTLVNMEGSVLNRTFNVEEYGFEAGRPGCIAIDIVASPKPDITWHFDNITIKGGESTDRFMAATLATKGHLFIHWTAKLFISQVTEEDFHRDFYLTAKNEFVAQAYKVVFTRPKTTEAPTTTTLVTTTWTTTTQSVTTTRESTSTDDAGNITSYGDTTPGYTEYQDSTAQATDETLLEGKPVTTDTQTATWATGGAITGIVIAVILLHVALVGVFVYGRRSEWQFLPAKARRRFRPAMSMDNLVDQVD